MQTVTVIVPACNAGDFLDRCLTNLANSEHPIHQCILVDDASTVPVATDVLTRYGIPGSVMRLETRTGPARARNLGAIAATGRILLFIDSDVAIHADAVGRIVARFAEGDVAAVFGSYDNSPSEPTLVSQFRNLLHCYVHHQGRPNATTFWSGCGAVRREVYFACRGFDAAFRVPGIEDIEFGGRMHAAGYRIELDPKIQATHMKRWRLWPMIYTDIRHRGTAWTRLLLSRGGAWPDDLNLTYRHRVSAVLAMLAIPITILALGLVDRPGWIAAVVVWLSFIALNAGFLRFLARCRGIGFAVASLPLYLLYYHCCVISLIMGFAIHFSGMFKYTVGHGLLDSESGAE